MPSLTRGCLAAPLACAILAACQPAPSPQEGRILGLLRANVSSFGVTEDGCTISALFDDFVIGAGGRDAPVPGQDKARRHERGMTVALAPPADEARLVIDLRGYYRAAGAAPAPGLSVQADGKNFAVKVPDGSDDTGIDQRFEIPLAAGATRAALAVVAMSSGGAQAGAEQGSLGVDSLDIALIAGKGCAALPDRTPAKPA